MRSIEEKDHAQGTTIEEPHGWAPAIAALVDAESQGLLQVDKGWGCRAAGTGTLGCLALLG
eukprot:3913181-Lingulodinium_polyedra.AAC.1